MRYLGNCVALGAEAINAMRWGKVTPVSYDTFRRRVGPADLASWARSAGFDARPPGVTLRSDPLVHYYRATFEGYRCYYLTWSGFEHVWGET